MTFVSIKLSWFWWFPKIHENYLVTGFSAFKLTNWVTLLFYTDQRIDSTIDNHFDHPFATAYIKKKNYLLGSITCRYSENAKIEPKNFVDDKICKEVNAVFIQILKFVKYSVLPSFFTFPF